MTLYFFGLSLLVFGINIIKGLWNGIKEGWNTIKDKIKEYYIGLYFGNGTQSRTIQVDCGFTPNFAIVYASAMPSSIVDFDNKKKYNYSGIASSISESAGIQLTGQNGNFIVKQDILSTHSNEYSYFNEAGTGYIYILFR